jgi:hypothetical protein
LKTGNFDATERLMDVLHKNEIKFKDTISTEINKLKKVILDISKKYKYKESDFQIMQPAFRWAQSKDTVFIEIKFSHRMDSPGILLIIIFIFK